MQTFLPYKKFIPSLACLDDRRLGKQRVEALQILNALKTNNGWKNHPAVKMWRGYEGALELYKNIAITIWISRGFKNTMRLTLDFPKIEYPPWITEEFCASHRSNLLLKDPIFYGKYNWKEPNNLPYRWPV